ncbi:ATP-binding protein [Planococcus alpniumensis]|uniref:ATP-binding protein n=1 Tax=Planococcus alpniumensis TaxID=2708345 RepID=UPI001B8A9390|nr:ATP-binding protein [Planococcus sp. MSAK28401]
MNRSTEYLESLLNELRALPKETGWVEFKGNNQDPQTIGQYISALSNTAAYIGKSHAYLVWGIEDETHEIIGTTFKPSQTKKGNEELESWLLRLLSPRINFIFFELKTEKGEVVILEIERAMHSPVRFENREFIRIGSYKKPLSEHSQIERELWRIFDKTPFENMIAKANVDEETVLKLLDYTSYFSLQGMPVPKNNKLVFERLMADEMIEKNEVGLWNITNLGAILFATTLSAFPNLKRKSVRVIVYSGKGKLETLREQEGAKGYASGFEGLIQFIDNLLPRNEVIKKALRQEVLIYPELSVRELVANAIVHQDFSLTGTGPMIEIFENRMEITNPGVPLVNVDRFLDSPPRSRNEALASFLRRVGVCEERGSGFDKVVAQTETYQLPPPTVEVSNNHTRVTLYAPKSFSNMELEEKIHACYLHACLKYVMREQLTNATLRARFGLKDAEKSKVSRLIKEAVAVGKIKPMDPDTAPRHMKYVPFWA